MLRFHNANRSFDHESFSINNTNAPLAYLLVCKRSIFGVIHNTQPVMSDYPKDNFFGITNDIDRKNTRSRFLETSPRAMAGLWIIPGKLLSTAGIASAPV